MLGINKVGDRYNYKNTASKNNSSKVSFGDLSRLGSFETEEFVRNFLEHQAGREAIVERLGKAKQFLPQLSDKPVSSADKAIHFFVNLYETLVKNPKMRVEDAIGDGLNLEAVDRMFISQPFKRVFSAVKDDNKYSKFADELSKGLYDDSPDPVTVAAQALQKQAEANVAAQPVTNPVSPKKKLMWESKGYVSMVKETQNEDEKTAFVAQQKIEALLKSLKEEKTTYEKKASGIEVKLDELEKKKANLTTEMHQANKSAHRKEMIESFLNPESFNQKEIAQAERDLALSPEKQEELAKAQKELKDRKLVNNKLRKNKNNQLKNFNTNLSAMKELKQKIELIENSKTMTAEALKKKEILLAQRQMVIEFNNKTVTELEADTRHWTQAMLKSLTPKKGIVDKDKVTGKDLLQMKLKELSSQEQKTAKIAQKRKQLEEFLDISSYNREKQVFIEGQFKFDPVEHNKLVLAISELYAAEKSAKNKKLSPEIKAKHEEKVQQLTKKVEELRVSEFATPELLKKRDDILAQRQAVIDFNKKTVAKLKADERPFIQKILKAVATKKEIDLNKTTGRDLLNFKIAELKAEEEKLASPEAKIKAINLDIIGFGEEHKAYTNNIEQLERKIEDIEFEQGKAERELELQKKNAAKGIEYPAEKPAMLPKKKKNPTNIDKQKRHMSTEEKRAASLELKAKRKERKEQYKQEVLQKTKSLDNEIDSLENDLRSYKREINNMTRDLEKAETQRQKLMKKSPFMKAEEVRQASLNTLKRLMNETEKDVTPQQKDALSKKVATMPSQEKFGSVKAFKHALRKIFKAKQKLEGAKQKEVKNNLVEIPNVRLQRQIITESSVQYPNIKTITQKIEQVKKLLSPEAFNQKELSYVEHEILAEQKQELLDTQALLSELKAANEVLKPFTGYIKQEKGKTVFVKFDSDAKMAEFIKREPKEQQFTTEKAFKKNLESWQARKTEFEAKKAKAEMFFKNEEEIKKCEQRIAQLEAEKILTPQAAKQKEILLAQRQEVIDFNNNTIKQSRKNNTIFKNAILGELSKKDRKKVRVTKMTGHELLELRLKELEAKKQELLDSDKAIWDLSKSISQMTSDRDLLKTKATIAEKYIKDLENQKLSLQKMSQSMQKKMAREPIS